MGLMFKNGIPYAGVPDEIDAATVGGHTVEADVPADAAFTDTINSDITAEGNPVILKDLQGGVPFSEITVKGENISGQEMTLTATGKNQLPITVTSGTGAGVTYTVDNDEITVSGTTTGVSTITISAPNMTITQDMRLSYRGNLSGMTPKATVLRNGETVYPTPNDTTGSKLLAGDVLQNVYIQQQNADVAVSGSAKFQLEYGTEVTEYEKYSSETYTFTPDSADYVIPTDIIQKDGVNILVVIGVDGATLSTTGVKADKAIEKLWQRDAKDMPFDDTVAKTGSNNVQGAIEAIKSLFTPVRIADIAYDTINSSFTDSTFATVNEVPWQNYEYLIFTIGRNYSVEETIIVPTSYFSQTTSTILVQIKFKTTTSDLFIVSAYQDGNNSIQIKGTLAVTENERVRIYGCVKK